MYEILTKEDLTGATLVVKINESDLDIKAMHTILNDRPSFIIPFHYKTIDGQVEFTYQIGNLNKMAYISGKKTPPEYASMWFNILNPLLECGDWFMNPFSFVLNIDYLYNDKNSKEIKYVYIPSKKECSDYAALKDMVAIIVKQNKVTDVFLQNNVLWAIQDFNPTEFLLNIQSYQPQDTVKETSYGNNAGNAPSSIPQPDTYNPVQVNVTPTPPIVQTDSPGQEKKEIDDIEIDYPADKKEKKKCWFFRFNKSSKKQSEIIGGAAKQHDYISPNPQPQVIFTYDEEDSVTQLFTEEYSHTMLDYVGKGSHPDLIEVLINEGEQFTIGRYDIKIKKEQSDFEFPSDTKAVSRKHAVIMRKADGYYIDDLTSRAGTIINGQKIIPNVPQKLMNGSNVSFGNLGADYIWRE